MRKKKDETQNFFFFFSFWCVGGIFKTAKFFCLSFMLTRHIENNVDKSRGKKKVFVFGEQKSSQKKKEWNFFFFFFLFPPFFFNHSAVWSISESRAFGWLLSALKSVSWFKHPFVLAWLTKSLNISSARGESSTMSLKRLVSH